MGLNSTTGLPWRVMITPSPFSLGSSVGLDAQFDREMILDSVWRFQFKVSCAGLFPTSRV
jgi:hypothetical protein